MPMAVSENRSKMLDGRLKNPCIATCALIAGLAFAEGPVLLPSIVGLWRYGENDVWIQIDQSGSAYQCRIGKGGSVFSSTGTFVQPSSIEWDVIWGTDKVVSHSGVMHLEGPYGAFEYRRASQAISEACLPARNRSPA
jgi:hypothetical protein